MPTSHEIREPGAEFEVLLIAAAFAVMAVGVTVWLGARLAIFLAGTDGHVEGGLGDWLQVAVHLVRGRPPVEAWGELATNLPGPPLYWVGTGVVAAAVIAVTGGLVWLWKRTRGSTERRRFGQRTEAREALPNEVAPLAIPNLRPPTGRMLLGRMLPRGPLLATEDRVRHPLKGSKARRQGNRGSVALIGPTGSGKTALAASALVTWDGPVVAVSVKRDLYDTTAAARSARGEVAVFDPGMATGLASARWSPLEAVTTSSGALRTGRALAQAIPRNGVTNADYWAKHGEKLLGAFMGVAGLSRLLVAPPGDAPYPVVNMEHIATWVTTMADASDPVINRLLKAGLDKTQPLEVKLIARHASVTFVGVAKEDHKVRSSIYSTASHAIDPWLEPSVAHSATNDPRHNYASTETWEHRPKFIDLEWLMGSQDGTSNTLYLAASQPEFERLSPVLGGLLADLKDTIHAWDIAGRRLDKPLLILIDEAGQLELGWLPSEVSTIAALGAFFVTCWQNLSQIQHRYGTLADAVLSGHRTKCFFAGVDDLTTTRYLTGLLGSEYVTRMSTSNDVPGVFGGGRGGGRRSVSRSEQRVDFAPANTVRQMNPGEAVLLHGTLPPIHVEAVRWWAQKELAALVPLDVDGHPNPPDGLPTCPLGPEAPGSESPAVDETTLVSTLAELASLGKKKADPRPRNGAASGQMTLPDTTVNDRTPQLRPSVRPRRRRGPRRSHAPHPQRPLRRGRPMSMTDSRSTNDGPCAGARRACCADPSCAPATATSSLTLTAATQRSAGRRASRPHRPPPLPPTRRPDEHLTPPVALGRLTHRGTVMHRVLRPFTVVIATAAVIGPPLVAAADDPVNPAVVVPTDSSTPPATEPSPTDPTSTTLATTEPAVTSASVNATPSPEATSPPSAIEPTPTTLPATSTTTAAAASADESFTPPATDPSPTPTDPDPATGPTTTSAPDPASAPPPADPTPTTDPTPSTLPATSTTTAAAASADESFTPPATDPSPTPTDPDPATDPTTTSAPDPASVPPPADPTPTTVPTTGTTAAGSAHSTDPPLKPPASLAEPANPAPATTTPPAPDSASPPSPPDTTSTAPPSPPPDDSAISSTVTPAAPPSEPVPAPSVPSVSEAPVSPADGSENLVQPPESGPLAAFPSKRSTLSPAWVTGSGVGPAVELAFPVLGPVRYSDGWGAPRGAHGERRHEGTDILGVRGQPLRAAFDGTVTRYQLEDRGISGAAITITRADGLRANYFHVNTDDLVDGTEDAAPVSWRIPTALRLGSTVSAGQIIGFMGDSGNAVGVPHLHFELRTPDGVPFNPFPALRAAEDLERCGPAFGPWANVAAVPDVPVAPVVEVLGSDGASWQLTARGEVVALGRGAEVGDCDRADRSGR